jgi:hypothetical protein
MKSQQFQPGQRLIWTNDGHEYAGYYLRRCLNAGGCFMHMLSFTGASGHAVLCEVTDVDLARFARAAE